MLASLNPFSFIVLISLLPASSSFFKASMVSSFLMSTSSCLLFPSFTSVSSFAYFLSASARSPCNSFTALVSSSVLALPSLLCSWYNVASLSGGQY